MDESITVSYAEFYRYIGEEVVEKKALRDRLKSQETDIKLKYEEAIKSRDNKIDELTKRLEELESNQCQLTVQEQ